MKAAAANGMTATGVKYQAGCAGEKAGCTSRECTAATVIGAVATVGASSKSGELIWSACAMPDSRNETDLSCSAEQASCKKSSLEAPASKSGFALMQRQRGNEC